MSARAWTAFEIHQIAYLTAKGWVPENHNGPNNLFWSFSSDTDPDLDAWCSSIDDAYEVQRCRDVTEKETKAKDA